VNQKIYVSILLVRALQKTKNSEAILRTALVVLLIPFEPLQVIG